jgi:uncharacterized protein YcbK (DUF882 family)
MRLAVMSLAATLAFAGAGHAQSLINPATSFTPEVLRGFTPQPEAKKTAAATPQAAPKAAPKPAPKTTQVMRGQQPAQKQNPPPLRATRYGAAPVPAQPQLPPPSLDTTSPRSLSLVNFNTKETLNVTYWSDGAYHRDALDKLNAFLKDSRNEQQTEMDPLVFDVLWHTKQIVGYTGQIEVLSAYRSPETNAWLASVSRGVARDSQHMNGNAMDVRFPGVPVIQYRQAARSLEMGGVGFYPRSGFVHLDTGPVRYW